METNYIPLFNYGTKFTHDAELVKDSIQDLFLNLWSKRANISIKVNVKAYLFSSLRRGLLRKISSSSKISVYDTLENEVSFSSFQISIEQQFVANESTAKLVRKIATLMETLPPRQMEVIYLKYYHNFDRNEIAEAMNITPQTVSNLLQLGLKKLKADFKQRFNPDLLFILLPIVISKKFI
jgi:RNA polymerase sigma factor (sigma-70 family)